MVFTRHSRDTVSERMRNPTPNGARVNLGSLQTDREEREGARAQSTCAQLSFYRVASVLVRTRRSYLRLESQAQQSNVSFGAYLLSVLQITGGNVL